MWFYARRYASSHRAGCIRERTRRCVRNIGIQRSGSHMDPSNCQSDVAARFDFHQRLSEVPKTSHQRRQWWPSARRLPIVRV